MKIRKSYVVALLIVVVFSFAFVVSTAKAETSLREFVDMLIDENVIQKWEEQKALRVIDRLDGVIYDNDAACGPFTRNIRIGMTGRDVTMLQEFLVSNRYLTMPPNVPYGKFGFLTLGALAGYQRDQGIIPSNGYFGTTTRAKFAEICGDDGVGFVRFTSPLREGRDNAKEFKVGESVNIRWENTKYSGWNIYLQSVAKYGSGTPAFNQRIGFASNDNIRFTIPDVFDGSSNEQGDYYLYFSHTALGIEENSPIFSIYSDEEEEEEEEEPEDDSITTAEIDFVSSDVDVHHYEDGNDGATFSIDFDVTAIDGDVHVRKNADPISGSNQEKFTTPVFKLNKGNSMLTDYSDVADILESRNERDDDEYIVVEEGHTERFTLTVNQRNDSRSDTGLYQLVLVGVGWTTADNLGGGTSQAVSQEVFKTRYVFLMGNDYRRGVTSTSAASSVNSTASVSLSPGFNELLLLLKEIYNMD